ncbi:MAG TPA: 30S ribosomal protein S12 methylthiotransferase RimO [bacterium]|nr:30S ribosomal protein S12 methylthiotransferase RimO [bacterium]HOL35686.1 30S ribosomal protein S12 methylthiotransferase RimO [bacterium]HPP07846.1 30S ribosomal protein S12 methylthiotransferase RimO [bacterium]
MTKKLCVISLGCPKNTVDSEKIIGILGEAGYEISLIPEESDFVIVNTCAFIKPAINEARQVISFLKDKKRASEFKLIVTGCLPARNHDRLLKDKDIDGIIGPYCIERLPEIFSEIESGKRVYTHTDDGVQQYYCLPRAVSTFPYAYIKIAEGCSNRCSYCTIPMIRGPLYSFSEKDILKEAESLFTSGIKELVIVGHDITAYGKDYGKGSLCELLRNIVKIGFPWIRLMYLHPSGINQELLELMSLHPQICKYLDIPLQHINPEILKKMNRPVRGYRRMIEDIRRTIPDIALRTTLIVGFPGETEDMFQELLDFVREMRFEKLGAFIYYPEKGTPASGLPGQIPYEKKNERYKRLMCVQKKISKEIASSFQGKTVEVLIEKQEEKYLLGRTQRDAPDIDWTVKVHGRAKLGDIVNVRITETSFYSLEGMVSE